jgi:hypothetical protein
VVLARRRISGCNSPNVRHELIPPFLKLYKIEEGEVAAKKHHANKNKERERGEREGEREKSIGGVLVGPRIQNLYHVSLFVFQ